MEWISVNDRLPEKKNSHVLVFCEGGNIDKSFCINDRDIAKSYFNGVYTRKSHGKYSACFQICHKYGYKVTHWMPLPNPPTE